MSTTVPPSVVADWLRKIADRFERGDISNIVVDLTSGIEDVPLDEATQVVWLEQRDTGERTLTVRYQQGGAP